MDGNTLLSFGLGMLTFKNECTSQYLLFFFHQLPADVPDKHFKDKCVKEAYTLKSTNKKKILSVKYSGSRDRSCLHMETCR